MMKFIFGMQIDIKVFCKLILSFWVCVTIHTQSTQNKKFAYLCNISRKTWETKLIFCLSDKKKFSTRLQCLFRCAQPGMPKIPKITSFQYLCNILRKTQRMKFLQINIKGFFKLILSYQVCVVKYSQITQNNKFGGIQFLRYHKMTKIWTPPPPLLAPVQFW